MPPAAYTGGSGTRPYGITALRRARALPLPWWLRADVGIGPYEASRKCAVGAGHWPARHRAHTSVHPCAFIINYQLALHYSPEVVSWTN